MNAARLRSVLYVPSVNERALARAPTLAADGLILDLEDAVAPDAKAQARVAACEFVRAAAPGALPAVAIRVNAIGTAWHRDDLAAAVAAAPDAIVLPKVGCADDVLQVERALQELGANERTRLWAMLETPGAVLRSGDVAAAGDRLSVLVMGTNDLLAELRAGDTGDRAALQTSLGLCVLAARAAGRTILDGVYNDVSDARGLEAECRAGRQLGFDGKTLIHPAQIDVCNRVFSPSEDELRHARRVITAYEQARQEGRAVATLDGRLIEELHVRSARRIVDSAGVETST